MAKFKITSKNTEAIEGEVVPLEINVSKSDPTGSVTVDIGPLPADASLTAGSKSPTNVWTLNENDLNGLRLFPGPGLKGAISLDLKGIEKDSSDKKIAEDSGILNVTIAELADDALRARRKSALVPATQEQRFGAVFLLVATLIAFFVAWFMLFEKIQDITSQEFTVSWQQPQGTVLSAGPSSFWYDIDQHKLHHLGIIDDAAKDELVKLLIIVDDLSQETPVVPEGEEPAETGDTVAEQAQVAKGDTKMLETYKNAVSELAYQSNKVSRYYLVWLFLIAGVSGMIGVQARAIGNFIKIACFSNVLDLRRFWPWYVMRPALGFILGATIVLLVESSLFVPGEGTGPRGTLWWLAIAFVVGFGADDFTGRLRLLSQTLFGKSTKG
jgi:hypothetical protein